MAGPSSSVTVNVGGEMLTLLPEKAAWLAKHRTLLVADLHIGKAVSFRRQGVPVPHGTTEETLGQLAALVQRLDARRVVVLGDFLHSAHAHAPGTLTALARWREAHAALAVTLVRGNHDQHAGDPPSSLGFDVVNEPLRLEGLALCHHPQPRAGAFVLAGHLHPCIHLSGRAHDSLRLACFHFTPHVGVLPAFGAFTGMHAVRPEAGDHVFAVADGRVFPLGGERRESGPLN
jgi:DNA ligase-associated metallophosphoesterase